jgi:hypothetical protein
MEKINFLKKFDKFYNQSSKKVTIVDVPVMNYLMIDGEGDPNKSKVFSDAVEILFSLSYTIKFMIKKGPTVLDYGVMPLEGVWWVDDISTFTMDKKDNWKWTMMIMQPEFVTESIVECAFTQVNKKKKLCALENVRFKSMGDGYLLKFCILGLMLLKILQLNVCIYLLPIMVIL